MNPFRWLAGTGPHPAQDTRIASPVLLDPMYYDPYKVAALVGPSDFATGIVANFSPAVREKNVIASVGEAGWTAEPQDVIDYTPQASDNAVVNRPNMASGVPAGVSMVRVQRALEEQLTRFQDFMLGAP